MFGIVGGGRKIWRGISICFVALFFAVNQAHAYKPPPPPPPLHVLIDRANNGDSAAQRLLGMQYLRGENGAKRDRAEARKWFSLAAQSTDRDGVQAKWMLGMMFYYGIGGQAEKQRGLELQQEVVAQNNMYLALGEQYYQAGKFSDAATILAKGIRPGGWPPGEAVAQRLLGLMHLRGDGVARNDIEAFNHFCRAAFGDDGIAMMFLAGMYAEGNGVEKNHVFQKVLLKGAAKRGVDFSKSAFKDSVASVVSDGEVIKQLLKPAELNDSNALYSLGLAYRSGRGVAASDELAVMYLENPVHQANADASFQLAEVLASIPKEFRDRGREHNLLSSAAQRGHVYAMYRLAMHISENAQNAAYDLDYARGFHLGGIEELASRTAGHASESYQWLTKAGQLGIAASYSAIASRYAPGCAGCPRYVPIDNNLQMKYAQLAAENGHVPSMVGLGYYYSNTFSGNSGVSRDIVKARRWFSKAAEQHAVFAYDSVLAARRQMKVHAIGGDSSSDKRSNPEICGRMVSP